MRLVVSLLLLVLVAITAPVEAYVAQEAGPMAPIETHVPSETAEKGEHETVHVTADALADPPLVLLPARSALWMPGVTRATPPTRPPR